MKKSVKIPFKLPPQSPPHLLCELFAIRLTCFGNEWYHVAYNSWRDIIRPEFKQKSLYVSYRKTKAPVIYKCLYIVSGGTRTQIEIALLNDVPYCLGSLRLFAKMYLIYFGYLRFDLFTHTLESLEPILKCQKIKK